MDAFSWVTLIATVLLAAAAVTACCRHDLLLQRRRDDYRPANTRPPDNGSHRIVSPQQQARSMVALTIQAPN